MGIIIGSAVVPVSLAILWSKLTGLAAMIGSIVGTGCGIISWLLAAYFHPDRAQSFYSKTCLIILQHYIS